MLIFVVFFYVYHMHNIKLVFAIWEDAGRFAMIITTLLREAWQCVLDFNNIETVWLGQGGRQDYLYTLGWLWEISRRVAGEYFSRLLGGHSKLFFPCWLPFAQDGFWQDPQQLRLKCSPKPNSLTVSSSLSPPELPAAGFVYSLSPSPLSVLVCLCSWVGLITGSHLWLNTPATVNHLLQMSSSGGEWLSFVLC